MYDAIKSGEEERIRRYLRRVRAVVWACTFGALFALAWVLGLVILTARYG